MRFLALGVWLGWASVAWAHPGATDACGGHTVSDAVHYTECQATATGNASVECADSEVGEHHFHFSPTQMDEEVLPSLAEYRRTHPAQTPEGIDYGSFVVEGRTYDIWQITRQGEAIVHCVDEDDALKTGVVRIR